MKAMQGMLAVLVLFVGLCTVAGAEAGSKQLHTLFIVTVDQGPSEGLVVQGKLTADVDPGTGVLSGTLTPGPNPSTGLPYTSVVFTTVGGTLVPNPHVTALEVRGRLEHAPGAVGGPAAGPQAGDLGDWEAPCCSLR
jgi:hypothetical protein